MAAVSSTLSTHRQPTWKKIVRNRLLYLLLLPTFLLLFAFTYYPAGLALLMSLFDWKPGVEARFIGTLNFRRILGDRVFWTAMRNTGIIALWTFTIPFVMPLIVAEIIHNLRSQRAKAFYRIAILIPILVPGLVTLQLWRWLYSFPSGGLNALLHSAGFGELARPWLGTVETAMPALLFIGFPWITGTAALIYLAGLLAIPTDTLDAAKIDGCSTLRRIISIDIPQIMGQVRFFVIFGIIEVFQEFGPQLVLTQGGPYGSTMVPGMYLYIRAFGIERFDRADTRMGEACAVGVLMFVLILVFSYIGHKRLRISGIDS